MTRAARTLLARADALLAEPEHATVGTSARLAAFLARQAVESLIDARCTLLCGVQELRASSKAKLAILKSLDTTPAGPVLVSAWHQLTGFCHQHAYQLSPTVDEVQEQCRAVRKHCLTADSGKP